MRTALLGTGSPLSVCAFHALAERFEVAAVIVPGGFRGPGQRAMAWSAQTPLRRAAARRGVPVLQMAKRGEADIAGALSAGSVDLLCVASFPWLVRSPLLDLPRCGALNIHTSLLPRHRGPDPLFWTYLCGDRHTGVTVHWMDRLFDAGDIAAQEQVEVPRGHSVEALYDELTQRGARLLQTVVSRLSAGDLPRKPQAPALATHDPRPSLGTWRIQVRKMGAEQLWHVVSGLGRRYDDLLTDAGGQPVRHGLALGYQLTAHDRSPGDIERTSGGLSFYCHDGVVQMAAPRRARRLRHLAGRLALALRQVQGEAR